MKATYAIYNEQTGIFVSRWTGSISQLECNIPAGHKAVPGNFDLLSNRVDLETGNVVPYQPPRPSDDHDWDTQTMRWRKSDDVQDWELKRIAAIQKIELLEKQQARPLRELRKNANDAEANRRLDEIDAEITELRKIVTSPKPGRRAS